MSFQADIKTLGFKDMHEEQVEAFLRMVDMVITLADAFEDPEIFEQAFQVAEDAVLLFGGSGIQIKYEAGY